MIPSLQGFEGALKSQVSGPLNATAGAAGAEAGQSFGSRFTGGLSSLASQAGKIIAGGFAIGAAGAAVLGGALIKTGVAYNTLEQSSLAAFKTILGSSEAATKMQDSIRAFALTSPFPRQAFIEGTQQLLGFGVSAQQIIPTLSAIQDSVAAIGGNATDISQVTFALAEVKGQGKLTGETLNQLGQFGIDAASIIGGQMGKTGAQIREMASRPGGIPADQVFDPLVKGLTEKFGGAAAGLKQTFTGAVDRIKGAFRDIASDLAEPFVSKHGGGAAVEWANTLADVMRKIQSTIVPVLAVALGGLAARITPFVNRFRDFITNLSTDQIQGFLKRVFDGFDKVRDLFGKIGPLVSGVFTALGTFGASGLPFIGPLLSGISPLLAGFVAIAATSPQIRDAFKSILPIVSRLAKTLGTALAPVLPVIAGALGDVAGFVADLIAAGIEALAPIFSAIVDAVVPLIPIFTDLVTSLRGPLLDVIQTLTPVLKDLAVTLGGALADAVKEIAPVLPGLARTLAQVAISVGTALAGALTSLAPALPAFAELVRIGAELIAKVPPDVLAAIVLGFLAFKGLKGVTDTVSGFTDKIGLLKTGILSIGTSADGSRTLLGKLIDKIGALASAAVQNIALKIGISSVSADIVGGAAGEAGGAGLSAGVQKFFKRNGFSILGTAGAIVTSVGFVTAAIVTIVLGGIIWRIANPGIKEGDQKIFKFLPSINEAINFIGNGIQSLATTVWNAFWNKAPSIDLSPIGDWLSRTFSGGGIGKLPDIGGMIGGITSFVSGAVDDIWAAVKKTWNEMWAGIGGFDLGDIWEKVLGFFQSDNGGGSASGKGGGGSGGTLGVIDTSFLDEAFTNVFNWFTELPTKIANLLPDPFNWIKSKGVDVIGGFIAGIGEGILNIAAFVIGLPGAIKDWIGDTGTTLLDKGLNLIGGFLGGIGQKTLEVATFIIGLPAAIVTWIGDTGSKLIQKGVALIGGFFAGIIQKASEVFNWFVGLPGRIVDAIPDVGGILHDAGVAIIRGLRDGIIDGAHSLLKSALETVTSLIPDWKPIATDHLLLKPAGLAIMEGLRAGIHEGFRAVESELGIVTKSISDTTFSPKTDFNPVVPAPSISPRDLAALQTLSIEATTTAGVSKTTNINVQALEPGTPLARAISREQSWAEKTSGRDD